MSSLVRSAITPTRVDAKVLAVSLTLSAVLFAAGLLIGYFSLPSFQSLGDDAPAAQSWNFGTLVLRNMGAACLLYVGAVTGGSATLITLPLVGLYVGATAKIGVVTAGGAALLTSVAWYVPFEFLGCLAAAAGGLYPLVATLRRRRTGARTWPTYTSALAGSLLLFAAGTVLILCGAAIEAFIITQFER
ncbi:hypothetical protein ACOM2C_14650 [Pseudarthrobacter sp. So.54]